ncbi:MAG TPA: hypothetical protein VJJ82_03980, partial [Candidatus Nanoarchaeia archaeon]|nr:hypothetical protein [Candidatus Nanoarchaeia archaeon]
EMSFYKRFLPRQLPPDQYAIKYFSKAPPLTELDDAIALFTDGSMGEGLNGGELAKAARNRGFKGPIFLLTGEPDLYLHYQCPAGATEVFLKDNLVKILTDCCTSIKEYAQTLPS